EIVQAVGAEQEEITDEYLVLAEVRRDLLLQAEHAGHEMPAPRRARLVARHLAGRELRLHERVIGGQPLQSPAAPAVHARVADMGDTHAVAAIPRASERGAHPGERRIAARTVADRAVRRGERGVRGGAWGDVLRGRELPEQGLRR